MYPELHSVKPLRREHCDAGLSVIRFRTSKHTIGRSLGNDTVVPWIGISRSHCEFVEAPDRSWVVRDLSQSRVRITVNGLAVPKRAQCAVNDQDIIKFDAGGEFTYVFQHERTDVVEDCAAGASTAKENFDEAAKNSAVTPVLEEGEFSETACYEDISKMQRSTDVKDIVLDRKLRVLEEKIEELTKKLKRKKENFSERIEEICRVTQERIDRISEEKLNAEKEKFEIEEKYKNEIQAIIMSKEIEIRDVKSHIVSCQEQKQKDIAKLKSEIKLYQDAAVSEQTKVVKLAETLESKEKEVSKLIRECGELKNLKRRSDSMLKNAQTELKEKERENAEIKAVHRCYLKGKRTAERASCSSKESLDNADLDSLMNAELQCSVCNELFIRPVVLNCGHTFCRYCLDLWKKNKNKCPICRSPITSEANNVVLNSLIESAVSKLDEEVAMQRLQCAKDREAPQMSVPLHTKKKRRRH